MRSVREKRGVEGMVGDVGEAVLERRASRTWDPVGERARVRVGGVSAPSCESEVPDGKSSVLISLRRKGIVFEGVGRSADWMMCEVVVYIERPRRF